MDNPIETLTEIRSLMTRSSRFLSLSGLSGVCAGTFALVGAWAAWAYKGESILRYRELSSPLSSPLVQFLLADALLVLVASLAAGMFFSWRKARKQGLAIWDANAARLVVNLMVPLAAGGVFCLGLLYHGWLVLLAPVTLIFYGLALINGSKYTLPELWFLGASEIALGLLAVFWLGYGLFFWALGFGVLHILYGFLMYWRYER